MAGVPSAHQGQPKGEPSSYLPYFGESNGPSPEWEAESQVPDSGVGCQLPCEQCYGHSGRAVGPLPRLEDMASGRAHRGGRAVDMVDYGWRSSLEGPSGDRPSARADLALQAEGADREPVDDALADLGVEFRFKGIEEEALEPLPEFLEPALALHGAAEFVVEEEGNDESRLPLGSQVGIA